ncbi:MAG: DNA-3-methyladenine glycosylase 2 family protein [Undibacterium sp.]|uniref:DNA-3-methyladenine glycosylase family protein n=1 Tax=Undibacterium sp. TaxID=1914977 RepID=UPI0027291B67|nr:DNA-3-methyladenine glycosylase 2 family protein [Undibacterium sp.]MDO8653669.1 DNA-3-methyladenine glycosylase 2 family protein [Undibacterium sp.]
MDKSLNDLANMPQLPEYWEMAKNELMKRDRIMRKLIPQFGDLYLIGHNDSFTTLTRSIVAQQISGKSANLLWQKFLEICPKATPMQVIKAGAEKLVACGLSRRKTEYILDLAEHFKEKRVHVDQWDEMTDEDVISELMQIRGIGRWTAEMFLIFNLLRPNILPLDDPSLLKGISLNYFSGEPVSRSDIREVAANWEPWRTVATWYLWRSLDPVVL